MAEEGYYRLVVPIRKVLLPFDLYDYDAVACAEQYGRIRHELDSAGGTMGALDLLIAAHALGLNATLVTNNQKHFRRVNNLAVENWTQAASDDE
jgi:tRNA(fMet)-specific endonuclease VapC